VWLGAVKGLVMSVTVQSIDLASLSEQQRNGLAILENLSFDHLSNLKRLMDLSEPGIIGPQTLDTFVSLCGQPEVGIDLSNDGVTTAPSLGRCSRPVPSAGGRSTRQASH
jgi:hypothetical protein